jgi:hypothetical protein
MNDSTTVKGRCLTEIEGEMDYVTKENGGHTNLQVATSTRPDRRSFTSLVTLNKWCDILLLAPLSNLLGVHHGRLKA